MAGKTSIIFRYRITHNFEILEFTSRFVNSFFFFGKTIFLLRILSYNVGGRIRAKGGGEAMSEIYLDNSATTRPCKAAVDKIVAVLTSNFGNPSSLHEKGFEAEKEVERAREIIAKSLNARSDEIFFTSGGTEANNIAVFGAADANKRRGNKIVTTSVEHSSVYNPARELEKQGYDVVYLRPDETGRISIAQIEAAIDADTILVSVMMVNNEVGSIFPVEKIKKVIEKHESPAVLHVDAVQAFGKLPVDVEKLRADLVTVSAHKTHGPKGVGALFKRKGVRVTPRAYGGEQQQTVRPGTEPVALIAGFGAAVEQFDLRPQYDKIIQLNRYFREGLVDINGISVNSPQDAASHIINISTNEIKSETMLHFLSARGIFVSSGSACAKGRRSRVLSEMGLPERRIDTALRISFSKDNTRADVDELLRELKIGVETLAHI